MGGSAPANLKSQSVREATEKDIERINELIKNARGIWFAMLGVLVFTGITLIGVEDIDFFGLDRTTQLPLVNVSVPTLSFFWAGPALVAVTYIYFQFYLEYLWQALAKVHPGKSEGYLADKITPWFVTDTALQFRAGHFDANRPDHKRNALFLRYIAILFLVWGLGPVIIFSFWLRGSSAHIVAINISSGLLLTLCAWVGICNFWHAWRHLRDQTGKPSSRSIFNITTAVICILLAGFSIPLSYYKTNHSMRSMTEEEWKTHGWKKEPWINELQHSALACTRMKWETGKENINLNGGFIYTSKGNERLAFLDDLVRKMRSWPSHLWLPTRANLSGENLTQRPEEWLRESLARKDHDNKLLNPYLVGQHIEEWKVRRKSTIDNLETPHLWERDFTFADLGGAFMAGAQFRDSNLSHAYMRNAILEEANFKDAVLRNTNLVRAHLEGADFHKAKVLNSDFQQAKMHHSDLDRGAHFEQTCFRYADLELADMQGSTFENVSFLGANLTNVRLKSTKLVNVDMGKARLFGVGPADQDDWGKNVADIIKRFEQEEGQEKHIDDELRKHAKTANQFYLALFMCQCGNSAANQFEKINVKLAGFRYVDFRKMHAQFSEGGPYNKSHQHLLNFEYSYGDGTSLFLDPASVDGEILKRPDHWAKRPLDRKTYMTCWRSWLEKNHVDSNELFVLGLTPFQQIEWDSAERRELCK